MIAAKARLTLARRGWLMASLGLCIAGAQLRAQDSLSATFVGGPCPDVVEHNPTVSAAWIRCGTLTLPQNRALPKAKLAPVVLPVLVIESPTAKSHTPILFLAGGPGEPAIDVAIEIFLSSPFGRLAV